MELIEITWGTVHVGDVMFQGTVVHVGKATRSRAGRVLITVRYDTGVALVREVGDACNVFRG